MAASKSIPLGLHLTILTTGAATAPSSWTCQYYYAAVRNNVYAFASFSLLQVQGLFCGFLSFWQIVSHFRSETTLLLHWKTFWPPLVLVYSILILNGIKKKSNSNIWPSTSVSQISIDYNTSNEINVHT